MQNDWRVYTFWLGTGVFHEGLAEGATPSRRFDRELDVPYVRILAEGAGVLQLLRFCTSAPWVVGRKGY